MKINCESNNEQTQIRWVRGNTQPLSIPLEQEVMTENEEIRTEPYYPSESDKVTVYLVGRFKRKAFTPEIDGNVLIIREDGTLSTGSYHVEVLIEHQDGTRNRSLWCNQVVVTESNDTVLEEWDEFKQQEPQARAAIFFFAKGDKGAPFTYEDFTQEQIEDLKKPAVDAATELTDEVHALESEFTESENERVANEEQRKANEISRVNAETSREQQSASDHTTALADHSTASSDHTTASSDHLIAQGDHSTASDDHDTATADHTQAESDSTRANTDHSTAVSDHSTASSDHTQAESDTNRAGTDHSTAADDHDVYVTDHSTASSDHSQAVLDSSQASTDHTRAESDHSTAVSDHSTASTDHTTALSDSSQAATDHSTATVDHQTAASDHSIADGDHTIASADHTAAVADQTQAASDHTRAENDNATATSDHSRAVGDHITAAEDHTQAVSDHTTAAADHTTAESDHAAVEVYVDSLGAFDISAYHATGGVLTKYADLAAALDSNNGGGVPQSLQKGGMSVKFVQSSDNNYVQSRYMLPYEDTTAGNAAFLNPSNWQGIDNEPTAGSENLVKSGGVVKYQKVFPKMSYIGLGTGLTYADSNVINNLIPGHKYRIYVKDVNAVSDITGTSSKIRIIAKNDLDTSLTLANYNSASYIMPTYYDIVMPVGYTRLYIQGRADENKEVVFYVSDETEVDNLLKYTNKELNITEFPYNRFINTDGSFTERNDYVSTDYIEVIPGKIYRITSAGTGSSSRLSVAFYNYDGNTYTLVNNIGAAGGSVCYVTPTNANRVVISSNVSYGEKYGRNGIVDISNYVREFGSFHFYSLSEKLWRNSVLYTSEYYSANYISNLFYYNILGLDTITINISSTDTFDVIVGYYNEDFGYINKEKKTSGSTFTIPQSAVFVKIGLSKKVNGSTVATTGDDVKYGMISITGSYKKLEELNSIVESLGNDITIAGKCLLKVYQNFSPLSESNIFTHADKAVSYANGKETDKSDYSMTDYIFLKNGVSITYNSYVGNSNYASLAVYNASKTYVKTLSVSSDTTQQKKVFVAPYDCYIRLSADSRFNIFPAYFRFTVSPVNLPERVAVDEEKIATLENTVYDGNLPTYWQTYLTSKEADIKSAIETAGNHGDIFIFFSDYHYRANTRHTPDIIRKLYKRLGHPKVFNGGDVLNTHNVSGEASNMLEDFVESFAGVDMFNIFGNHDGNPYASDTSNKLSVDYWYNILFRDLERKYDVVTTNKGYYYFDNPTQKMRYIILNTYDNGLWNNSAEHVAQLDWLCGVLNAVQDGWYVVVLTHMFYEIYTNPETSEKYIAKQTGALISAITDAYQNKTTGSYSRLGDTYTFDFTNAHGKMAAIICGHVHYDYSEQSEAGYPIISIEQDAIDYPGSMPELERERGTYTEQAFDIMCIDTVGKVIKTVRIGAGNDRLFSFT